MEITDITLPTLDEMNVMNLEELREWVLRLKPFYNIRFEISELYDFEEYKKTIRYLWFYTMIENIKNGIDRWERIADYPKS
ncbi:hypothetical protein ABD87_22590 [Lysinibacillus sphaericus]|uniref:hypothetical protein n=1 Tax=Lysinibacillus sphaericus TaxID=1421 RepID=UPI0018CF8E8B|nr:hypothetical protein [Lysinibacillus sphaericus]MBG9732215.1 hypothetical protein [Lysinibacillus sphaericus]